jgi:Fe-S-cluster-containing hydrogenase component 2
MKALSMDGDGLAEVDLDRCIGCGLCVTTCPSGAMKLMPKAGDRFRVPPATSAEQMKQLAQQRAGV